MKAFIVQHAFKYISSLYIHAPRYVCIYVRVVLHFPQFQENIFVKIKFIIAIKFNRNKIHDVEMKSTIVDREGVRRKMSQGSNMVKLRHNQCSFVSMHLESY